MMSISCSEVKISRHKPLFWWAMVALITIGLNVTDVIHGSLPGTALASGAEIDSKTINDLHDLLLIRAVIDYDQRCRVLRRWQKARLAEVAESRLEFTRGFIEPERIDMLLDEVSSALEQELSIQGCVSREDALFSLGNIIDREGNLAKNSLDSLMNLISLPLRELLQRAVQEQYSPMVASITLHGQTLIDATAPFNLFLSEDSLVKKGLASLILAQEIDHECGIFGYRGRQGFASSLETAQREWSLHGGSNTALWQLRGQARRVVKSETCSSPAMRRVADEAFSFLFR